MNWKDIPDYPGYQVSDCGSVRSLPRVVRNRGSGRKIPGGVLAPSLSYGYPTLNTRRGGGQTSFRVHVLVALVWIGPRPDGYDISHKDGDKTNNKVSNLCYLSHGLHCRKDQGVPVVRSDGVKYASIAEAAGDMGCTKPNISKVCRGENKSACGFGWAYQDNRNMRNMWQSAVFCGFFLASGLWSCILVL